MSVRLVTRIILGISVAALGIAEAQGVRQPPVPPNRTPSTTGLNRISQTCPDTNRGDLVFLSNGGALEYPNGSFMSAEVGEPQPGSGWVVASCTYGAQWSSGLSPVYWVRYKIQGFTSKQCTVSGKTVTCVR